MKNFVRTSVVSIQISWEGGGLIFYSSTFVNGVLGGGFPGLCIRKKCQIAQGDQLSLCVALLDGGIPLSYQAK